MIFRRRDRSTAANDAPPSDAGGAEADEPEAPDDQTVIDLRERHDPVGAPEGDEPQVGAAGAGAQAAGGQSPHPGSTPTVGGDRTEGSGGVAVATAVDHTTVRLLQSLTEDLATAPDGIEFIYRSLDRIAGRVQCDDAVLVVVNDDLGRQAFRAGRRPIESTWGRDVVRSAPAGLHLLGSTIDDDVASSVANLSSLALRLDVATHDSLHDSLTGLLNRRSFDDQLETACSQSVRYGWGFSLVLIDLDNFKSVNDRLGHQAGDTILRAVGAELRSGLRAGDAAARVGGDEFALILPNADESLLPSLLERLRLAVLESLPSARVGLSAGMSIAPEDGTDMGSLFRMADQRLYEAKAR